MARIGPQFIPDILDQTPYIQGLPGWAQFLTLLFLALLASQIVTYILSSVLRGFTKRTENRADDILIDKVQQPLAWLIFSVLVYASFTPLNFPDRAAYILGGLLQTVNIILGTLVASKFIGGVFKAWKETIASKTDIMVDDTILPILSKFVNVAVWVFGGILVLRSWGIQVTPFLAGLGIAGLAIGFALRDSLSNIVGGIALAFDAAYRVGDKIKLSDGTIGIVEDITLRSTRIHTFDGDLVMVPNGKVANENIYTYAQPNRTSRISVSFGVEYGASVKGVQTIVEQTVAEIDGVQTEPAPNAAFENMGDSALEFRALFWVENYEDAVKIQREATERIYNALTEANVGIPYPTQTIHVVKE